MPQSATKCSRTGKVKRGFHSFAALRGAGTPHPPRRLPQRPICFRANSRRCLRADRANARVR
jgi:hypothetical protein